MRIMYIGNLSEGSTSGHRCAALRRLGNDVVGFDPYAVIQWNRLNAAFHYRTGYSFVVPKINRALAEFIKNSTQCFDLIWVDNGELISAGALTMLRSVAGKVINYNCDDPTGRRDGMRWFTFLRSIKFYDLCVVVRFESEIEYLGCGARKVLRVWRSADEVAHAPRVITPKIYEKWGSEVAFVGTWMPERGPFMLKLIQGGVPLSIWGNRWCKAKEWAYLKQSWRGPALIGDDYAYAIQCAKVNLGLLSKGNRDLHTQRSAEIPALGALLCAERTSEHLDLYEEGRDAIFWSDADECISVINRYLMDRNSCLRVAESGRRRFESNLLGNESVAKQVLLAL